MTHRTAPTRRRRAPVDTGTLAGVVDLARRAPSIHNTQPWCWVADRGRLELWRDLTRRLPASDPSGRQQVISCGAALHHAVVAGRALGLGVEVEHLPDSRRPDLLARVHYSSGLTRPGEELVTAIGERCTDRRRFTSWPLSGARMVRLAEAVEHTGTCVVPVLDPVARVRIERLVEAARRAQLRDAAICEETARWVDRSGEEGVPVSALPIVTGVPGEHPHRFGRGPDEHEPLPLGSGDGLVVVATAEDDTGSWLVAGETLSELWLRAVVDGLSVVPLAQAVEDGTARAGLRGELHSAYGEPQVLLRLGWQAISRRTLPRTPRRALNEVFHER